MSSVYSVNGQIVSKEKYSEFMKSLVRTDSAAEDYKGPDGYRYITYYHDKNGTKYRHEESRKRGEAIEFAVSPDRF